MWNDWRKRNCHARKRERITEETLMENFIFCVVYAKQHGMRDDDETFIPHAHYVSKHNKKQKVYKENV